MPRPRIASKIQIPPRIKGFNPMGYYFNPRDSIQLNLEEYEVIRLLDYEGLSQVEAAELMNISRPTLTRVYARARNKIATALTESRQLKIEGGTAVYNDSWFECRACDSHFNKLNNDEARQCPLCRSEDIVSVQKIK